MSTNFTYGSMPIEDFYPGSQLCQDDQFGFDLSFDNSLFDNLDPELRAPNQPQASLSWQVQQQFQQQNQLQRFMQEPERIFFSAAPLQVQQQAFYDGTRPGAPISSLPRVSQNRMGSPSPSQGALTSTCSSGLSPPAENDWPQDNIFSPQIRGEEQIGRAHV